MEYGQINQEDFSYIFCDSLGGIKTQSMLLLTPVGDRTRSSSDHTFRMICYSAGTEKMIIVPKQNQSSVQLNSDY